MKQKILVTLAALLVAGPLSAAQIQFDLLEARFDNAVGGNLLSIDDTYGDPVSVTWGQAGNTNPSGYVYENRATPFEEDAGSVFALGSFTHNNFVISSGTGISQVDLYIRGFIKLLDDEDNLLADFGQAVFSFRIFHDETPNSADPCKYPEADNTAGCADGVTISTLEGTDVFSYGGFKYTLSILGFSESLADAENGIFSPIFFSAENAANSRILAAAFTAIPVPAPAAGLLLLGGIGAIGFMRRRSRAA